MTNEDLNRLVWPAMRYALGRKTFMVDTVCNALIANAKNIRDDIRDRMAEEISSAIKLGSAGRQVDVDDWERVLKAFGEATFSWKE